MQRRGYAVIAAAVAVVAAGGVAVTQVMRGPGDVFAACRPAGVTGGSAIGGPFTLVDSEGETVTDDDVIDRPSLLYFGYTFCPDICPADNARNAAAVNILQGEGYAIQPVFISIDPARDTPETVGKFAGYMHPDMIGLTGSPAQVKAASDAYHTYYDIPHPEKETYLVNHSTYTYLVLPGAGSVGYFRRDLTGEELAGKLRCYLDAAPAN